MTLSKNQRAIIKLARKYVTRIDDESRRPVAYALGQLQPHDGGVVLRDEKDVKLLSETIVTHLRQAHALSPAELASVGAGQEG